MLLGVRTELIKSNKYEHRVELDPKNGRVIREAWELLITDRYTLDQICEEFVQRGHIRQSGRPWAWTDSKTGKRLTACNRLHRILHNPFYAGWVVSKRFGIVFGEIRGKWEPIVSTHEFERGLEILRRHDHQKVRNQRHFYLSCGLLWLREKGREYKVYDTTPSGKFRSYSYYMTRAKVLGKKIHIPCKTIDQQIPQWLAGIAVNAKLLPDIKEVYRNQVGKVTRQDQEYTIDVLRRRVSELREEEAQLGRLLTTSRISEETYDQLRLEWQEKIQNVYRALTNAEREAYAYLDDLDAALLLLASASLLFNRLEAEQRSTLLQVLTKRIYGRMAFAILHKQRVALRHALLL